MSRRDSRAWHSDSDRAAGASVDFLTDVLFHFDVAASPATVLEAVKTTEGIMGFWKSQADVPAEVGGTLELGFAIAPLPFDLRLEHSDLRSVVWRTETFPPHWIGTTVRWEVDASQNGSTVSFRHEGFSDDEETGRVAYTRGQIMTRLAEYAKTGEPNPVVA